MSCENKEMITDFIIKVVSGKAKFFESLFPCLADLNLLQSLQMSYLFMPRKHFILQDCSKVACYAKLWLN